MSIDEAVTSKATQPLHELRSILSEARTSDDADRIHSALVDVVDGLITHAEKQARLIEDLRSDMGHKQGIVSKIGGGGYEERSGTETNTAANDELDL